MKSILYKLNIMDIISVVGSLVSIISGIWAFSSAKTSKKIKEELFQRIRIDEFSVILSNGRVALKDVRKIGPTANSYRGIKTKDICDSILIFTESIIENKSIIKGANRKIIYENTQELQKLIYKILDTDYSDDNFRELGTCLYNSVLNLVSRINELKKESIGD